MACHTFRLIVFTLTFLELYIQLSTAQDNPRMLDLKDILAERELEVLAAIAEGEKIRRDDGDEGSLKGKLDDDEGDDDGNPNAMDEGEDEEQDEGDESGAIGMDSFIIQKLHNTTAYDSNAPHSTTYHTFDDSTFESPLFTRSVQDYMVDFIIFSSQAFPPGTGHYIVLRRLSSPNEPSNYDLDDELLAEDEFDYQQELKELEDESEYENVKRDEAADLPERPNPNTPEPPGQFQSGEENYADNLELFGPEGDGVDVGGAIPNEDEYGEDGIEPRYQYNVKIRVRGRKGSNFEADDPRGRFEVIYEAFSVNFKDSLHGYVTDIDPLQYSFLNNEEQELDALMEDDGDAEHPIGEGDDDSDSDEEEDDIQNFSPGQIDDEDAADDNIEMDKEFQAFQKAIMKDAGMQKKGGILEDTESNPDGSPFFNLPGDEDDDTGLPEQDNDDEEEEEEEDDDLERRRRRRKKRSPFMSPRGKKVQITSSLAKKSVEIPGCLRPMSISQLILWTFFD